MKYYGQGSRNEYRITRFGKNFEFINDDHIGDLIILAKLDESDYLGYVLSTEEDIEGFMMTFGLAPGATNQLIDATGGLEPSSKLTALFQQIAENTMTFPTTTEMAKLVRECHTQAFRITDDYLLSHSDEILTSWVDAEYKLFEILEDKFFLDKVNAGFPNVKAFTQLANEIINRRKSRAGKSLEKHLASIFEMNHLVFEEQAVTEDNKKPDFIFQTGNVIMTSDFPLRTSQFWEPKPPAKTVGGRCLLRLTEWTQNIFSLCNREYQATRCRK